MAAEPVAGSGATQGGGAGDGLPVVFRHPGILVNQGMLDFVKGTPQPIHGLGNPDPRRPGQHRAALSHRVSALAAGDAAA